MGLDFSHCRAHWSYGGFNNFRKRLAEQIGINLDSMEGFCREEKGSDWTAINDDIKDFLYHSDCDGLLTPDQCNIIAPRLGQLIADWDDGDYDKEQALELISGMEGAVECEENLGFH